jgi:hypothetical protein
MAKRAKSGGRKSALSNKIIAEAIEKFFPECFKKLESEKYETEARVHHNKGNSAVWKALKKSILEKHGVKFLNAKVIVVRWNSTILKDLSLIGKEEPRKLPHCMRCLLEYGQNEEEAMVDGEESIDLNDTFYELKLLIARQKKEEIKKPPRQPRRETEFNENDYYNQGPQRSPSMVDWDSSVHFFSDDPSRIQTSETASAVKIESETHRDQDSLRTLSLLTTSELEAKFIPKYLDTQARASPSPAPNKTYRPVYRHWFYQNLYWHPFAMTDSLCLDDAITSENEIVVTDGGRFEVNLKERRRSSIYWLSGSNAIRRCSWFYKNPSGAEANLIPFEESAADFMESEFEKAMVTNSWNNPLPIPDSNEFLLMKDSANIEYHQMGQVLTVKRGVDEFLIDDGEEAPVDHLILSVSNFGDKIDDSGKSSRTQKVRNYLKCLFFLFF